jgi:hypothetical protein
LLADKQVLQYDETEGKWKNVTLNVVTALSNLSDCTITTPTENQVLQYNGTSWVNATLSLLTTLSSLTDCTITSASTGQVLKYNGSKWVNASDADTLATLTDVSVSNPSNDQLLVFTTASSLNKWTPYTLSGVTFNDTNKTITVSGTLSSLTDCTITTASDGQVLKYNGSKWVNASDVDTLATLTDVSISNTINLNVLAYNYTATKWENKMLSMAYLNDILISSAHANDILMYSGSKWINSSSNAFSSIVSSSGAMTQNSFYTPVYNDSTLQSTFPMAVGTDGTQMFYTPNAWDVNNLSLLWLGTPYTFSP